MESTWPNTVHRETLETARNSTSTFPYSRLEETRRNRTVRKYHGRTGKHELAMDECLELANRFFLQFPKVCI